MLAQAQQPADDVRNVAAEDAPIGVQLVDHDDTQLLEELEPFRVMRKDRRVEHVRVRHDDLAGRSDGGADRCRRVAVIRRSGHTEASCIRKGDELGDLILSECLCREEAQGACRRIFGQRLENGEAVTQCLARGRRRHDDNVLARPGRFDCLSLMPIQPIDPTRREPVGDPRVQPSGQFQELRRSWRDDLVMDHAARQRRLAKEVRQDCIGWSRGVVTHSTSCLYLAQMFCFADDSATIRLSCAS